MNRDIKELDTDKMLINPSHPQLRNWMDKKIPRIKESKLGFDEFKGFTRTMVYRYILLMYDVSSPIQELTELDWMGKKFEAMAYAGFELKKGRDGYARFHERVDEIVVGKNSGVNDMIIHFLAWTNNYKWKHMVYLHESHTRYVRGGFDGTTVDVKSTKEARAIWNEIREVANDLGHVEEETEEFRNRFYYQIEQSRLAIRPEDYAQHLSEGGDLRADNPYGVNYIVDKIKFAGDTLPNEI